MRLLGPLQAVQKLVLFLLWTKKNLWGCLPEKLDRKVFLKSQIIISPNAQSIRYITTVAFLAVNIK